METYPCLPPAGLKDDRLTRAQCEALQRELSKTGGQLTAAAIEALRRNPEFKDIKFEDAERWRGLSEKKEEITDKGEKTEEKPAASTRPDSAEAEGSLFDRYVAPAIHTEVSTRLKPFGYDLFAGGNLAPSQNLPVASDYTIGPGDEVNLLLWGRVSGQYNLTVSRDGTIFVPNVGALSVAGMTFEEMRGFLKKHTKNIIGAEINVTMGRLRSIQVFVLGEVKRPGAYTVSAMSTLTNAMIAAGGAAGTGTLRNVELKRGSGTIAVMDFYDLLLRGDKSKDSRLQNNDVIFVPIVGPLVGIAGNVKRPGVYEVKDEAALASALDLAGGIIPAAFTQQIQVERIERNERRVVIDVNAKENAAAKTFSLQDGDLVKVYPIVEKDVNAVYLYGNVKRPGKYELKPGMRLKGIIRSEDDFLKETYFKYGLIKRVVAPAEEVKLITINLEELLFKGSQEADIPLSPRDSIYVFSKWSFRERPAVSIEGEVRCVSGFQEKNDIKALCKTGNLSAAQCRTLAEEMAKAGGFVTPELTETLKKRPEFEGMAFDEVSKKDEIERETDSRKRQEKDDLEKSRLNMCAFELQENLTVKDLVLMAGGVKKDASFGEFELYRTDPVTKTATLYKLNLAGAMDGYAKDNVKMQDMDRVVIHSVWEQTPRQTVKVIGDVNRPGDYPYAVNMTVKDLVFAAGNLLESAYLDETELVSSDIKEGRSFYMNYRRIDLRKALAKDPAHDIALKPRDTLLVKRIPEWVGVMNVKLTGEVVFPGRYPVKKGERLSSLIERAGGFTDKAYLKGAVFTRESVRVLQQKNINESVDMFEQRIMSQSAATIETAMSAEDAKQMQAGLLQKEALIAKMRSAKANGRISIRLAEMDKFKGGAFDMALEDGDALAVPDKPAQVQVVGAEG
ncbi:MAG: SLBB domain-containing protein [Deltaproteobacteria bacterium]|nr:SLBB domain-containing protein [Deltaproteobacteria bacterium]